MSKEAEEQSSWWEGMVCPRCEAVFDCYPALSRVDNKTNICSPCGTREAFWDFHYRGEMPMPPVNEPIV